MKESRIVIEVGDANPLSFLSLASGAPSAFFCGDFPLLALEVNLLGDFEVLEGDPKVLFYFDYPNLVGDAPAPPSVLVLLTLRPGDSSSRALALDC